MNSQMGNVYRVNYVYLPIAPYFCGYDFTQHKLKKKNFGNISGSWYTFVDCLLWVTDNKVQ